MFGVQPLCALTSPSQNEKLGVWVGKVGGLSSGVGRGKAQRGRWSWCQGAEQGRKLSCCVVLPFGKSESGWEVSGEEQWRL